MKTLFALASALVACGSAAPVAPESGDDVPASTSTPMAAREHRPARKPLLVPAELQAVVNAGDRSAEDRALDEGRHPGELLAFMGLEPGMKVAELLAGRGYTTELLARAVGPSGVVFGQNVPFVLEKFVEKPWSERLAKPVMTNVVRVDSAIDDPLPAHARELDVVASILVYHDLFWLGGDRDRMNSAIFRALKPGGAYVIVDHGGRPGSGTSEVRTLHRIEEKVVRAEVEKAGFELVEEGFFLRNPVDARDWNASPKEAGDRRGESDRFALKYAKPGAPPRSRNPER